MPTSRGPREARGVLAADIVAVARRHFAERGFPGTSLRAIAAEIGVDPALVHYYFRTKEKLLEACMVPPPGFVEGLAAAAATPIRGRGAALLRFALDSWEDPERGGVLASVVATAAHEPRALERLRAVLSNSMVGAVAERLDDEQRRVRAALVGSQIAGLALMRYFWRISPLAEMDRESVVRVVAPTVQRYLNGRLDTAASRASP